MTPAQMDAARAQLRPYGYMLTDGATIVHRNGKASAARVEWSRDRWHVRAITGNRDPLLWSGADLGRFLAAYWYADKLPATTDAGGAA